MSTTQLDAAYRAVAELTCDFVYILQRSPRDEFAVHYVSSGLARLAGYETDELEPTELWSCAVHPADARLDTEQLDTLLAGKDACREMRIRHKDGRLRWILDVTRGLADADGRVHTIVGAGLDITGCKHTEASLYAAAERDDQAPVNPDEADFLDSPDSGGEEAAVAAFEKLCPDAYRSLVSLLRARQLELQAVQADLHACRAASLSRSAKQIEGSDCILPATSLDALFAHVAVLVERGTILTVNKAWRRFAAENNCPHPTAWVGTNYLGICDRAAAVDPNVREVAQALRSLVNGGRDEYSMEYPCHSAAEQRWFQMRASRFACPEGHRVVIAHENITERKQTERALRQREQLFRAMFEKNNAIKLLIDPHTLHIVEANPAACEFYGYSRDELLQLTIADINALPAAKVHDLAARAYASERVHFVFPHRLASGESRMVEVHSGPLEVDGRDLLFSIVHDITQRIRAEEALRDSEALYRTLTATAPDLITVHNPEGDYLFASPACYELMGYQPSELVGRGAYEFLHPDDRGAVQHSHQAILSADQPFTVRYRLRHKNGAYIPVETRSQARRDEDTGDILDLVCVTRDISQQVRAEEELRTANARLQHLLTASEAVIFSCHAGGDYAATYISENVRRILGYHPHQFIDDPQFWVKHLHPEDRGRVLDGLQRLTEHGYHYHEYRFRHADGRYRWLYAHLRIIRDEAGLDAEAVGSLVDITDRKQAEADKAEIERQLHHAQKLEAVGQLASGIAHDVGNLVTAICGHASLARNAAIDNHRAVASIQQIEDAAQAAAGVTRGLLTFCNKSVAENRQPLEMRALVSRSIKLLRRVLPASIEVITDFADEPPAWILADTGQLQQVIMNLVINARDAMPRGGTLRFSLRRVLSPDLDSENNDSFTASWVRLEVTDTGMGISSADQQRVFEPFFTTKPAGIGTGLGLSIVHGIVRSHGGIVELQSAVGVGTAILIDFPCVAPVQSVPVEAAAAPRSGNHETVLLAEDDAQVRGIVTTSLHDLDYKVIATGRGDDLLHSFMHARDQIQLFIVDIDLPGCSGLDCLQALRAQGCQVPAIVITANPAITVEDQLDECSVLLRKPFQMYTLIRLVDRLLHDSISSGRNA